MVLEPKALRRPCKPLDPMWKVERLADPTHLGKAQFLKSNSAKFSESMFPAQTRQMRAHSQKKIPGPESPEQSDLQGPDVKLHNGNMELLQNVYPLCVLLYISKKILIGQPSLQMMRC